MLEKYTPSCIARVFQISLAGFLNFRVPENFLSGTVVYFMQKGATYLEVWKEISENSNYLVSNTGRVRRVGTAKDHSMRDRKGYLVTDLYKDGERSTRGVHRLVAMEFLSNPDNKPEVNHKDGNKRNNHVSNLEWVTSQENCKHAWDNGLAKPSYSMLGKTNPNGGRKGKPFKIVETGEVFNTLYECEKAIDGNNRHINDCLRGRQRTHRGYHFEYV